MTTLSTIFGWQTIDSNKLGSKLREVETQYYPSGYPALLIAECDGREGMSLILKYVENLPLAHPF